MIKKGSDKEQTKSRVSGEMREMKGHRNPLSKKGCIAPEKHVFVLFVYSESCTVIFLNRVTLNTHIPFKSFHQSIRPVQSSPTPAKHPRQHPQTSKHSPYSVSSLSVSVCVSLVRVTQTKTTSAFSAFGPSSGNILGIGSDT